MARVVGALFSLDARGSLGGSIVYSKVRATNYVRTHHTPYNPNDPKQVNTREAFRLLIAYWQDLSPSEKDIWKTFAKTINKSGYNTFVGRGQKEYAIQLGTDTTPLFVTFEGTPPTETWDWTAVP